MKVSLVYRKPNPKYFSIEKVFDTVIPAFPEGVQVQKFFVGQGRASIPALMKNLFGPVPDSQLYHITGDIHYMALALPSRKTILTIHDCVFMNQSTGIKRKIMQWLWLKLPVRKCSLVTVISDATRRDVIRYSGGNADKIVVIENPVNSRFTYQPHNFNKVKPVLLQVGTWDNKNLNRVAEAIAGMDCHLRIIGQLNASQLETLKAREVEYSNVYGLSEDEIVKEYVNADVVVFASTYEGFGLPIIEGQTVGRAVVTSNISPMKEVAGDTAVLVDPYDVASIREGIMKLIQDDEFRKRLIEAGRENVKKYTASEIAMKYVAAYERILKKQD